MVRCEETNRNRGTTATTTVATIKFSVGREGATRFAVYLLFIYCLFGVVPILHPVCGTPLKL